MPSWEGQNNFLFLGHQIDHQRIESHYLWFAPNLYLKLTPQGLEGIIIDYVVAVHSGPESQLDKSDDCFVVVSA